MLLHIVYDAHAGRRAPARTGTERNPPGGSRSPTSGSRWTFPSARDVVRQEGAFHAIRRSTRAHVWETKWGGRRRRHGARAWRRLARERRGAHRGRRGRRGGGAGAVSALRRGG